VKIGTGVFREALKAIEPYRVGEEYAVEAVNCDLRTGAIVPMKAPDPSFSAPVGTERIHLWQDKLACFTQKDASVLPHPNNDNLVWAGTDYGQYPLQASLAQFFGAEGTVGFPLASSRFGVDAPPQAPVVVVNGVAGEALLRSTAYRFSAAAATGEESDLSLPSAVVDVFDGQTAEITQFWPLDGGVPVVPDGVATIRVYRAVRDQYNVDTWQFVTELPAATSSFEDTLEITEEVAQSEGWLPPVDFAGLVDLGGGIVVGWKGRDLCLSESGAPSAFPLKYRLRTDTPVVGVGVTGGFGIVLTHAAPYLLTATTPESATMPSLQFNSPCLSARSICSTRLGVVYATKEGLMQISSGGVPRLLTEGILSREQWEALDPENMVCVAHGDRIYGFRYGSAHGWMLDITKNGIVDITLGVTVSDAHMDAGGDRVLILDGTESVGGLGSGEALTARWKSALWMFATAQSLNVARILGTQSVEAPLTLKIWRDGMLHCTRTVTNTRPFMLPPGLYLKAQYEISGTAEVHVVHIVSDVEELGR